MKITKFVKILVLCLAFSVSVISCQNDPADELASEDIYFDNAYNLAGVPYVFGGGGSGSDPTELLDVYDATGGQIVGSGITLNLDTTRKLNGTLFSLAADEITINEATICLVIFRVTCELNAGTRNGFSVHLELDSGAGYNPLPGTYSYAYGREQAVTEGTATANLILDAAIGDKITVVMDEVNTEDFITIAGGSGLTIVELDGASVELLPSKLTINKRMKE